LFPVLSITTGELKARGLYVDEHALLTTSVEREDVAIQTYNYSSANDIRGSTPNYVANTDICGALSRIHLHHLPCHTHSSTSNGENKVNKKQDSDSNVETLSVLLVQPKDRPASGEELLVVVKLSPSGSTPTWILDLSVALIRHLRAAAWLSKSVIFIFTSSTTIPSTNTPQHSSVTHTLSSRMLTRWIQAHHRQSRPDPLHTSTFYPLFDFTPFGGIIRDAVVLDFLAPLSESHPSNTAAADDVMVTEECTVSELPPSLPTSWKDGYLLSLTGNNGLLPNMDVPAALLSMEPSLLHLETATHRQRMEQYAVRHSYLSSMFAVNTIQVYRYYWAALLSGMSRMVRGSDGWHGALLASNIESFSLLPMAPTLKEGAPTRRASKGES
jgi:hypothetical protein